MLAYEDVTDAVLAGHNAMTILPRELSDLPHELAAVGKEVLHD